MNKNVSVWRGPKSPPTNYHVWIKDDNSINMYDKTEWKVTSYPELKDDLKLYILEQIETLKDGAGGGTSLIEVTDNPKENPENNTIAINTSNGKVFFGVANKGWWFVTAQMLSVDVAKVAKVDGDILKISTEYAEYDNGSITVSIGNVKDETLIL